MGNKLLLSALLTTLLSLSLQVQARAELNLNETLGKLPALKQGIAFSLVDNKINYLSTAEIVKYKGFALEAGYAGQAEESGHKAVGVISYHIGGLKDLGVEVPILDLLDFNAGYYVGVGRIQFSGDTGNDNEIDHGLSLSVINIKF